MATEDDVNARIPLNIPSQDGGDSTLLPVAFGQEELRKKEDPAGFFKTFGTQFGRMSSINMAASGLSRRAEDGNPFVEQVDADWNPSKEIGGLDGIEQEYRNYVLSATGPADLWRRRDWAMDQQKKGETVKNGSFLGWVLGGIAGATIGSPESLIPIAGAVKYAKYAPTFLNAAMRAAPGMLLSSAIRETAEATQDVDPTLEKWAVNTFADSVFGSVFMGGLAAGSKALDAGKVWNLRKLLPETYKGVEFNAVVDKEGIVTGVKAVDSTGSLSAAEVDKAQEMANSAMAMTGIFGIPVVGEKAAKFFSFISPAVRMKTSRFKSVNAIADRVSDSGIITTGNIEGAPSPQNFENLWNQLQGSNRSIVAQLNGLYTERLGFARGNIAENYIKQKSAKFSPETYISKEQFWGEIREAVINDTESEHESVNAGSRIVRNALDSTYAEFRKAYNLPETWLPPRTARQYLMRVYDTNFMIANENEWHTTITTFLKHADEKISERMAPINEARARVKSLTSQYEALVMHGATMDRLKASLLEGDRAKLELKRLEEGLQDELRENDEWHIHVEDMRALSAKEASNLESILQPLTEKSEEVKVQKETVNELKKKLSESKDGMRDAVRKSSSKNDSTQQEVLKGSSELKEQLKIEEKKLNEIERERDEADLLLQDKAHSNQIDSAFYTYDKESGRYVFRNPNERLKLREVHGSHEKRLQLSKAYFDTITHQTPEQTVSDIFDKISGSKESPMLARTLIVPDNILGKFLLNDIPAQTANYRNQFGRRTIMKSIFKDVTLDGDSSELIGMIANELREMRDPINEKLRKIEAALGSKNIEPERVKKLEKEKESLKKELFAIDKEFKKAKKDIEFSFNRMRGIVKHSKESISFSRAVMSYAAATRLGFVPLTQITDLAANALQHGIWPFIRDGLLPSIKTLGGKLNTKEGEALREAAAHVNLGLQNYLLGSSEKNYNNVGIPMLNLGNRVSNGLESAAHLTQVLTGTTQIDNMLQNITSTIIQSKVMRAMHDFKAGKLDKKTLTDLLSYGLDPKAWADRFIDAYKKSGGFKADGGAYVSRFWKWADIDASNKMSDVVFRGVKNTVLTRGMLDAPLVANNPVIGLLFGFKGWMFASVNRYVIPAMQAADAQKTIGILTMIAAGALVSPLRRVVAGKSPYPDDVTDQQILVNAIEDSGFFSIFGDLFQDMNLLSGGILGQEFASHLKNDRYRDRALAGIMGPVGGIVSDIYDSIKMLASGDINQNDMNKLVRLIPFTQITSLRALSNKFVEAMGLPETRGQARKLKNAYFGGG